MPLPAHLTVIGSDDKQIPGSCDQEGRKDTIFVYALNHEVSMPVNLQEGEPTSKRIHHPFTIVKEFDKSTPLLFRAICTGETLKSAKIEFYRVKKGGKGEEHYFTITLTNAVIVSMKPYMPVYFAAESAPYKHMEEVSFIYSQIKWEHVIDKQEAEDIWKEPPPAT